MKPDYDEWKYIAGAMVGFGVGLLLAVGLFLFVGV